MDEIELRIGALETALIEIMADMDPEQLKRAQARLGAELRKKHDADTTAQIAGAFKLVVDGMLRLKMFTQPN